MEIEEEARGQEVAGEGEEAGERSKKGERDHVLMEDWREEQEEWTLERDETPVLLKG